MNASGDPVQAALEERRGRRAEGRRIECGLTLLDRCRDAAERRLKVRAFLIGPSMVAGTALAADEALLKVDAANGAEATRLVHVALDALVRLSVADGHARPRLAPAVTPGTPAMMRSLAELARNGLHLEVVTLDGSTVRGPLLSFGDRAIGIGASGAWVDWVDPKRIVSVAQIPQPAADLGHRRH